jgi:hypothetical protein
MWNIQRRWFRFSLRTLFLAVTVLACWLGYYLNWIRERHALLEEPNVTAAFDSKSRAPSISLRLLGERGAKRVFLKFPAWLRESRALIESEEAQRAPRLDCFRRPKSGHGQEQSSLTMILGSRHFLNLVPFTNHPQHET